MEKPINDFYKVKGKNYPKDGFFSWCKSCCRKHQKKYKEQKRLYMKEYVKNNFSKRKEWLVKNKERIKEYDKKRYYEASGKRKEYLRKRRMKLKNIDGFHTEKDWKDLFLFIYENKCFGCGKSGKDVELTKDHIIPISNGGTDNIENLAPLCRSCNSSKGNKGAEWYIKKWSK